MTICIFAAVLRHTALHCCAVLCCAPGPTSFSPVSADKPFNNLYYAVELPGVYKYIALTSYAPNQTFSHQEEQYTWLEQELSKVSDPISHL